MGLFGPSQEQKPDSPAGVHSLFWLDCFTSPTAGFQSVNKRLNRRLKTKTDNRRILFVQWLADPLDVKEEGNGMEGLQGAQRKLGLSVSTFGGLSIHSEVPTSLQGLRSNY